MYHLAQNGNAFVVYPRSRGKEGRMVILVRDEILVHFSVCKYVGDSMVWIKMRGIYKNDIYICFVCIAHENSIFYSNYDIDLFDTLLSKIAKYSDMDVIIHILAGDFNSRAGESKYYVEYEFAYHPRQQSAFTRLVLIANS